MKTIKITRRIQLVKPVAAIILEAIIKNILYDLEYKFQEEGFINGIFIATYRDDSQHSNLYRSTSKFFISVPIKEFNKQELVDKILIETCFDEYMELTKKVKEQICKAIEEWQKPEVKNSKKPKEEKI
jgi:hypothetical protein